MANRHRIWLIGAGGMSVAYANVLKAMDCDFLVIGRGQSSAESFFRETGVEALTGGLDFFLQEERHLPDAAIVAVGVEHLSAVAERLIKYGVGKILLEKPGGISIAEVRKIKKLAAESNASVHFA